MAMPNPRPRTEREKLALTFIPVVVVMILVKAIFSMDWTERHQADRTVGDIPQAEGNYAAEGSR